MGWSQKHIITVPPTYGLCTDSSVLLRIMHIYSGSTEVALEIRENEAGLQ